MFRLRRVTTIIFTSAALLYPTFVPVGECLNPEFCAEPCPAENSCYGDDDCEGGALCRPDCLPSFCFCSPTAGAWTACTIDFVGECGDPPDHANPPRYVITDLGTPGGWPSVALGVNELGQVVGSADIPAGPRHTYMWGRGAMTGLGTVPPAITIEAWDINNHAHVVEMSESVKAQVEALPYVRFVGAASATDTLRKTSASTIGTCLLGHVRALITAQSRSGRDLRRNDAATQRPVNDVGKARAWRVPCDFPSKKFDLFDFSSVTMASAVSYILEGHPASRGITVRASRKPWPGASVRL